MTQIDVKLFGKFKALADDTKVGKHTRTKRLFVGVRESVRRPQTSISTTLPGTRHPPHPRRSVRRLSQSFTTLHLYLWNALSNTNKQCSSGLQGSLLLSLATQNLGKGLTTWCMYCSVSGLQFTLFLRSRLLATSSGGGCCS